VIEKLKSFDTATKKVSSTSLFLVYINPILDGRSLTSMKCEDLSFFIVV
jgi:hypothetical protein